MNKQELIEHIGNTLDKYLKNTTFVKPVLSITEIAKSDKVSLEFEIGKSYILLDDVSHQFGYDKGKLDGEWVGQQLKDADKIRQELNKPVVKQFVADWYEENKDCFDYNLWEYLTDWKKQEPSDFKNWINDENNVFQTLVNMHQFGYEVEKEKRYFVRLKGVVDNLRLLRHNLPTNTWTIGSEKQCFNVSRAHTRKELEEGGFGDVFDSPLFEVEEVEE